MTCEANVSIALESNNLMIKAYIIAEDPPREAKHLRVPNDPLHEAVPLVRAGLVVPWARGTE